MTIDTRSATPGHGFANAVTGPEFGGSIRDSHLGARCTRRSRHGAACARGGGTPSERVRLHSGRQVHWTGQRGGPDRLEAVDPRRIREETRCDVGWASVVSSDASHESGVRTRSPSNRPTESPSTVSASRSPGSPPPTNTRTPSRSTVCPPMMSTDPLLLSRHHRRERNSPTTDREPRSPGCRPPGAWRQTPDLHDGGRATYIR